MRKVLLFLVAALLMPVISYAQDNKAAEKTMPSSYYNNKDHRITVPYAVTDRTLPMDGTENYSIGAWIKATSIGGNISKGMLMDFGTNEHMNNNGNWVLLTDVNGNLSFAGHGTENHGIGSYTVSGTTAPFDQWNYFLFVVDNTNLKATLYVNNVKANEHELDAAGLYYPWADGEFHFLSFGISGALDEVHVFTAALTEEEAAAAYADPTGISSLAGYYTFDAESESGHFANMCEGGAAVDALFTQYAGSAYWSGGLVNNGSFSNTTVAASLVEGRPVQHEVATYALTIVSTPEDDIYYTLSDENNDEVTDLTAIAAGTKLQLYAGTNSGRDVKVTLNDEELTMTDYVYTFNMPESDATLIIEAVETLYTVTISDVENGSIEVLAGETAVNSGDRVAEGTELTVNATPAEGYLLTSILVDGEAIEGNTVTVNADVTISASFEAAGEEPVEYCFLEGTVSRTDRGVTTLNITDNLGGSLNVEGSGLSYGHALYKDCTSSVFTTAPGAELTVNVTAGAGEWMHSYVYIDYDNDGVFEYDINTNKADNELVAFNCYGAGQNIGNDASTWYNSLGETLTGSQPHNHTIVNGGIPSFTLPADLAPGDYRIRFKTDWNDANPCGRTSGDNQSLNNGASMIDFTIRIEAPARDYALTIVCIPEDDIFYMLSDKNNDEVTDLTAIAAGTELTLNAGTRSGRDIKVTLNDEELSMFEYVYTFNMPESDATLTIEAVETLYTVTISDVENGSIEVLAGETAVNSGDRVAEGTELTVNATPAEGYLLTSILVDGEAIEGNTVTVNADVTISALFEEEAEEPVEYCTIEGTVSRSDRGVNTLNISDNFGGSLDVEGSGTRSGRAIYKDCTSSVFTTAPGAELTVNVTVGAGEWMHSYVYIDYNNNGVFEYDPSTTKADNELVAFNCYGAGSEATWYNSLGEILSDAHMFIANGDIPSFTLPADLADGDYRIRFKTDWNDANPCGRTTGGNLSSDNGASMIDFTIRIDANAAIDGIISDAAADATAEYYNLQGIKVSADNLTPGFYIVRQGDKATKVLIRK